MNNLRVSIKSVSSVCCMVFACFAAEAQPITLDSCQSQARANYPLIRQYALVEQSAEFTIDNVGKAWLPQLSFSAQASYQSRTTAFPEAMRAMYAQQMGLDVQGIRKDQYRALVEVQQTLWDGGLSRRRSEAARSESAVGEASLNVQLYALRSRVNDLFFSILLIDEQIAQGTNMFNILSNNLNKMNSLVRNGFVTQSDADMLEAQKIACNQQVNSLASMRTVYLKMLSLFVGRTLPDDVELQRPEPVTALSDDNRRPELRLFEAQIAQIDAGQRLSDAALMPRVGAFASGYLWNPGFDMFNSMFHRDEWSLDYMVGLRLQWNISAFYTRRNNRSLSTLARSRIVTQRDIFLFNSELANAGQRENIVRLQKLIADDERLIRLRSSIRVAEEAKLAGGVVDTGDLLQKIADEDNAAKAKALHEIELLKYFYEIKNNLNN